MGLTDSSKVALNIDVMFLRQQQFLIDAFDFTKLACLMSNVNSCLARELNLLFSSYNLISKYLLNVSSQSSVDIKSTQELLSVKFLKMGVQNESCACKAMHN